MLTVHHLGISQSERIVWLCEELGLDYEFRRYERRADNRLAPDEYKALHPMGIAPVIVDGDLVLGESGAICDYIDAVHGDGRLTPDRSDPDFADHLFWFHFANGTMMAISMIEIALMMTGSDKVDFVADRKTKAWGMVEQRLGEAAFFGGSQLTTADIMMLWSLTTARTFDQQSLGAFPNIRAYLQRIGERPAYRAAMAKAEPGMEPMLT